MTAERNRTLWRLLAMLLALTLVAAACGGGDDDDSSDGDDSSDDSSDDGDDAADEGDDAADEGDDAADEGDDAADEGDDAADEGDDAADEGDDAADEGDEPEEMELTDSWRGVTADTITVGASMLNFAVLQELNLTPNGWGDQQAIWEALIENLNNNGGINGRTVEGVYEFYSAIDGADADRACSALTEDNEVFAVLGGFVGPLAGTSDPCIVGLNETTLVGGEITGDELAQARAPWFTVTPSVEFQVVNLLNLLTETGRADGAKVFTMGGAAAADQEDFVVAELEARGIEVVGGAVIEAPDGDTLAQDAEMVVAFERFTAGGANTLMLFGTPSAYIRGAANAGLAGDIAIWANDAAGLENLGASIPDKSIADGVLTSTGPTDQEQWADPLFQSECVEPVAALMPESDFREPNSYVEGDENWFNSLRRYCTVLSIFVQVATAAGADLTPDSFQEAAFSAALDDFAIPGAGPASLSADKLGAADSVRLSAFDSAQGDGTIVPVTDLVDVFP